MCGHDRFSSSARLSPLAWDLFSLICEMGVKGWISQFSPFHSCPLGLCGRNHGSTENGTSWVLNVLHMASYVRLSHSENGESWESSFTQAEWLQSLYPGTMLQCPVIELARECPCRWFIHSILDGHFLQDRQRHHCSTQKAKKKKKSPLSDFVTLLYRWSGI